MKVHADNQEIKCTRQNVEYKMPDLPSDHPHYWDLASAKVVSPKGAGWYLIHIQEHTKGSVNGTIVAFWARDKECVDLDNIAGTSLEGEW